MVTFPRRWWGVLLLLLGTYFVFWTHSTWSRYDALELDRQTYSFDYAVFDEIMRSIWQSGQLYDGYDCRSQFGEHFVPLYYLLAPVYSLFPNIKTFLTLRIIASVLAALLLGAAAWKRWHDAPAVVCLIASFLLYVPLEYPLIGYFNIEIFVVPALAGMLYFADLKQWFGMLVCLLLMLMVKENYYLTAGGFLVYAVLTGKLSWRHVALGLFVLATLFVIVANWLIPSYNPFPVFPTWGDLYERWGVTTGSVIAAWLQQPGVALRQIAQNADGVFWGALLLPVAGLPLLAPELLPVWLPGILVTHLSNNPAHRDIHYFYHCEFIPLVFWGIIIAAARLRAFCRRQTWACRVPRRLMLFLLGLTIIMQMHEGQLLNRMRVKQPDMSDAVQLSHCLSIVPQSATLRCSRSLFLHVPTPWREYFAPLLLPAGPDYLLFYLTPEERDTYEGLSMLKYIERLIMREGYRPHYYSEYVYLLQRAPLAAIEQVTFRRHLERVLLELWRKSGWPLSTRQHPHIIWHEAGAYHWRDPVVQVYNGRNGVNISLLALAIDSLDRVAEAGYNVVVADSRQSGRIPLPASGEIDTPWQMPLTADMEGEAELNVWLRSVQGYTEERKGRLRIDTLPPEISVAKRRYGPYTVDPGAVITVVVRDKISPVNVWYAVTKPEDTTYQAACTAMCENNLRRRELTLQIPPGRWSSLQTGWNRIYVWAEDQAGNRAAPVEVMVGKR